MEFRITKTQTATSCFCCKRNSLTVLSDKSLSDNFALTLHRRGQAPRGVGLCYACKMSQYTYIILVKIIFKCDIERK